MDADPPPEQARLGHLAAALDPMTMRRLRGLGIGSGWRCLEVGAGTGSVARALADLGGDVVATDIDTAPLSPGGGVEVWRHDITADPLPEREFDLVHARLVLMRLPGRHRALTRMARALKPGGILLVEDIDGAWPPPVLAAPEPSAEQLNARFFAALHSMQTGVGADPGWAASAYGALRGLGLTDLHASACAVSWRGGGPGCAALGALATWRREALLATGLITDSELDRYVALLDDPGFATASYLIIGTSGRRSPGG